MFVYIHVYMYVCCVYVNKFIKKKEEREKKTREGEEHENKEE